MNPRLLEDIYMTIINGADFDELRRKYIPDITKYEGTSLVHFHSPDEEFKMGFYELFKKEELLLISENRDLIEIEDKRIQGISDIIDRIIDDPYEVYDYCENKKILLCDNVKKSISTGFLKNEIHSIKNPQANNVPECCICLESLSSSFVESLPCAHSFHCYCINEWKKKKNECPICKTEIIEQPSIVMLDTPPISKLIRRLKSRKSPVISKKRKD